MNGEEARKRQKALASSFRGDELVGLSSGVGAGGAGCSVEMLLGAIIGILLYLVMRG